MGSVFHLVTVQDVASVENLHPENHLRAMFVIAIVHHGYQTNRLVLNSWRHFCIKVFGLFPIKQAENIYRKAVRSSDTVVTLDFWTP